jgi:hypothetical protein
MMKLRIDPKKIRFRLTDREAEQLLNNHCIAETLHLPLGKKLDYLIKLSHTMHLHYQDNTLLFTVPFELLENLIQNPSKKGLAFCYQENNNNIEVLLQIDMACDFHC